jgi:hypothetical protein
VKTIAWGGLLLAISASAHAQPALPDGAHVAQAGELCYPAPPPGHTHDGFYARLQAGAGYLSAHQGSTAYSGAAGVFGFALGGTVAANLEVFATLLFHFALHPSIVVDGVSMPIAGSTVEDDAVGLGLAYYLARVNAYAAAAVTAASLTLYDKDDNRLAGSNTGLGFQVVAGKEWWVTRDWGLGAAAELTGAWMSDADAGSTRWRAFTTSLLFSATYN